LFEEMTVAAPEDAATKTCPARQTQGYPNTTEATSEDAASEYRPCQTS
jgi:hypothetical protein